MNIQSVAAESFFDLWSEVCPAVLYAGEVNGYAFTPAWLSANVSGLTGFEPDDVVGRADWWADNLHPDDRDRVLKARPPLQQRGEARCDYRFRHHEGHYLWISDTRRVRRTLGRRRLEIVGSWLDISAYRSAEKTIESGFRAVLENAPLSIALKDTEGRLVLTNERFRERFDLSEEEILGKTAYDLFPREVADVYAGHDRRILKTGIGITQELPVEGRDGNRIHFGIKFPVVDEAGAVVGLGVISTDVTESRRAEQRLRESEAQLRAIIDTAPFLIALKDMQGRYVLINRAFRERFGLSSAAVRGKTVYDLFPENKAEIYAAHERRVLITGGPVEEELEDDALDGRRSMLDTKFPIRDEAGALVGIGLISLDITDRKRSQLIEAQLMEAVDSISDGFALFDAQDCLVVCNAKYAEIHGAEAEGFPPGVQFREIVEKASECGLFADSEGREQEWIDEQLRFHDGPIGRREQRLRDGRWLLLDERRTRDGGSVSVRIDITDRKRMEEALRASELKFRDLAEGSVQGICICGPDGSPLFANQAAAHIFGYDSPLGILELTSVQSLVAPEERDRLLAFREARFSDQGAPGQYEFKGQRKNGSTFWLQNSVRVISWEEQPAIEATLIDVDARKQAERALRESEERYRRLIEFMPVAVIVHQDGNVVYCNPAGAETLGAESPYLLVGQSVETFFRPEDRQDAATRHRRVLDELIPHPFIERKLVRLDGKTIDTRIAMAPFEYNGEPAIQTVIHDVTAHKQAVEVLREPKGRRQRLKQRFIKAGSDVLADQEMLELVLYGAHPRGSVRALAERLMDRFGSFADVISAEPERLAEVRGAGPGTIVGLKSVQAAALRLAREQAVNSSVLDSWDRVIDYMRARMSFENNEQLRVLFLNRKNVLIADELLHSGTVDHTPLYPREVIKRALNLGATALVIVHNHPSGDPTPSHQDIEMTERLAEIGEMVGVRVHDHIIIGKSGHTSFKAMGLLQPKEAR